MTQETQVQNTGGGGGGGGATTYDAAAQMMASLPGVSQVTSFFQGNPMITPIGQMIEKATEATLPADNWALYLEVCWSVLFNPSLNQSNRALFIHKFTLVIH